VLIQRRAILDGCERQLRRLRMHGLDEEELRQFVAKFAGRNWEEFFEALFGYEAKIAARGVLLRGGMAGAREKYAAWREPIIAWVERLERSRKEARERKLLAAVEQANLLAGGASVHSAEQQAKAAAEAMVRAADEMRKADTARANAGQKTHQAPALAKTLMRAVEQPNDFVFVPSEKRDPLGRFISLLVGPHIRAVAAAFLIAACALWAYQNGLLPGSEIQTQAAQAVEQHDLSGLQQQAAFDAGHTTKALAFPGVPSVLTSWVDSFNVGLAGLLLLSSLYFRGNLMSMFSLIGAAIVVAGHHCGIRPIEPFRDYHVSLMLGTLLAIIGFRMGTR
jgi:hypothetical protein